MNYYDWLNKPDQAQIARYAKTPHHSLIVELNHPTEHEPLVEIFKQVLGTKISTEVNRNENLSIDDVRQLQSLVKLSSKDNDGPNLFILDMRQIPALETQNSLLKTLEEPTSNSLFILMCNNSNLLLKTIHSRSQILQISSLSEEQFARLAQHHKELSTTEINELGALTNNSFAAFNGVVNSTEKAKEILTMQLSERIKHLRSIKDRGEAIDLLNELIIVSSQAQSNLAKNQDHKKIGAWLKITSDLLNTYKAVASNGNLSLQLLNMGNKLP